MTNHTPIDDLVEEHKKKQQSSSATFSKEGEPVRIPTESKSEKKIELIESEPKVEDQDIEKYITTDEQDFTLDPELKKAGLQIIDPSDLDPRHHIQLPISDTEIFEGLDKPVNSSWRWLSEFACFILRQAHLSIKKIHGHVVRVLKK